MPTLHHLFSHLKNNGIKAKHLYLLGVMALFWTVFDSIIQYITPLILSERGFSNTILGIIIGSSSIAGAFFDFLMSRFIVRVDFRRIFMVMFAICFIYPFVLWQAKTVWLFLALMAVWGVYYDLYNFGVFNFISHFTKKEEHSPSFGVMLVFRSLGGILAPLIIGLVIIETINWRVLALGWLFLLIGFVFFLVLLVLIKKKGIIEKQESNPHKSFFSEINLWYKISHRLWPILILTMLLYSVEAFFWTLGPLFAETLKLGQFSGLFLMIYALPSLLVGWFVGVVTKKFGSQRTAFLTFLGGSLCLVLFFLLPHSAIILPFTFLAGCFFALSLPSVNGIYADCIYNNIMIEEEIESLEDFATNMGYVLGPIIAGVLADLLGLIKSFSIIGIIGVIMSFFLLFFAPKKIIVSKKLNNLTSK